MLNVLTCPGDFCQYVNLHLCELVCMAFYSSDSGNSLTKSIAISWNGIISISIGCSFVCFKCLSALALWHFLHMPTYLLTSSCQPFHMKILHITSLVQSHLYRLATFELSYYLRTSFRCSVGQSTGHLQIPPNLTCPLSI